MPLKDLLIKLQSSVDGLNETWVPWKTTERHQELGKYRSVDMNLNLNQYIIYKYHLLIGYYLTSSQQYFSYIQHGNNFNNIWKLYKIEGNDRSTR